MMRLPRRRFFVLACCASTKSLGSRATCPRHCSGAWSKPAFSDERRKRAFIRTTNSLSGITCLLHNRRRRRIFADAFIVLLPCVGNYRRARIGKPYPRSTHPLHSGNLISRDLRDRTSGCPLENTLHVHEVRPRGQTESQENVTVLPTTMPVPPA